MIGIIGAMEIEVAGITAALTDHKTETVSYTHLTLPTILTV